MEILNIKYKNEAIALIIDPIKSNTDIVAGNNIPYLVKSLYQNIPEKKRISYGNYHIIKILSEFLFQELKDLNLLKSMTFIYNNCEDYRSKLVALGTLSLYGLGHYQEVLPSFETAGASENWIVRESSAGLFRKLIKKYPEEIKEYLHQLVKSQDPNLRRFAIETLRPVIENQWFYKKPDYSLSILKYMLKEKNLYARTSVGNNLSDLARHLPDLIYSIIAELVENGDKNSYWIAYRACRNLVKKDPLKVMDILNINEYHYKDRKYKRSDYDDLS